MKRQAARAFKPVLSPSNEAEKSWQARLELGFERRGQQTVLARRHHQGPLLVQRPFYPEGGVCHLYVLHPPGGVVGGDRLHIDVACAKQAEVLLTTPAAGKFYRSDGPIARQTVNLQIADHAVLEWLPQETLLFDGAQVRAFTRIQLAPAARFIGWEITCLGRPACGAPFGSGQGLFSTQIRRGEEPLLLERMDYTADAMNAPWGLMRQPVIGNLWAMPVLPDMLEAVRKAAAREGYFGATCLEGLLVCRMLADQAEPIRRLFTELWRIIRPAVAGRAICMPRIWAT